MAGPDFILGYLLGRRGPKRWRGRERTRPKMPAAAWRAWAIVCIGSGVLIAWLLFSGSSSLGWRMVAGGIVGFLVGMYLVETIWERRIRATAEHGPIGPRS